RKGSKPLQRISERDDLAEILKARQALGEPRLGLCVLPLREREPPQTIQRVPHHPFVLCLRLPYYSQTLLQQPARVRQLAQSERGAPQNAESRTRPALLAFSPCQAPSFLGQGACLLEVALLLGKHPEIAEADGFANPKASRAG